MARAAMNQYLLVGNRKAESWQVAQNKMINVNGKQRQIRYCQNEQSIFVDEQNPKSKTSHIWIEKGNLLVNSNDKVKNWFLEVHPDNPVKFFLFDEHSEAKKELIGVKLENEARELFGALDLDKREAVATVIFGASSVSRWSEERVEVELYKLLRNNPQKMINVIDDPATELIFLTSTAIRLGIINIKSDKSAIVWGDTNHEIIPIPKGVNPLSEMSVFLKSNDGLITLQDIGQKIKGATVKKTAKRAVKKPIAK